mmetsp:Transcript_36011/g.90978  ORF Transcript_36011/g.90978 Transcript_36011/m.90978 type:complete len:108 (-) Transcript_36011:51-374(-)
MPVLWSFKVCRLCSNCQLNDSGSWQHHSVVSVVSSNLSLVRCGVCSGCKIASHESRPITFRSVRWLGTAGSSKESQQSSTTRTSRLFELAMFPKLAAAAASELQPSR